MVQGTPDRDRPVATTEIVGYFKTVDAAGRVYTTAPTRSGGFVVAIYTSDGHSEVIEDAGTIAPMPDASAFAVASDHGVTLYRNGSAVWTRALSPTYDAEWTSGGDLVVVAPSGMARLDATTGQVRAQRCGWSFGLSAQPLPKIHSIESLCSQLMR